MEVFDVEVSRAADGSFVEKVTVVLAQAVPASAQASCQTPRSRLLASTVKAKMSPVMGFTASAPRKMGHDALPAMPELAGQFVVVRPVPGWLGRRVQFTPSADW